MKRLLLILICFLVSVETVYASTNTYTRTENNLRISDNIEVTNSNKWRILATPSVDANEKIYDFADLFTSEEEEELYKNALNYINNYNMDLVIVTTNYDEVSNQVHISDTRGYGMDFYDYNDFGFTSKKNGILLIIDIENSRYEMITTGEAILMYDDVRIDSILDYILNDIKYETYYEGTLKFIEKASDYASFGIPSSNQYASVDDKGNITYDYPIPWLSYILTSCIIAGIPTIIIMLILIYKNKMVRKATTAKEYLDDSSVVINTLEDILIDTNIRKIKIDHSSSSSGGHSGGSSTSSGSSGISHGGGGRSF